MSQYLLNKVLLAEVKICKSNKKVSDKFIEYIQLMIDNLSKKMRYKEIEDKFDSESEAMLCVLKYWDRFDENITNNAFSYYTQMIKNGFAQSYNKIHPKKFKTVQLDIFEFNNKKGR